MIEKKRKSYKTTSTRESESREFQRRPFKARTFRSVTVPRVPSSLQDHLRVVFGPLHSKRRVSVLLLLFHLSLSLSHLFILFATNAFYKRSRRAVVISETRDAKDAKLREIVAELFTRTAEKIFESFYGESAMSRSRFRSRRKVIRLQFWSREEIAADLRCRLNYFNTKC